MDYDYEEEEDRLSDDAVCNDVSASGNQISRNSAKVVRKRKVDDFGPNASRLLKRRQITLPSITTRFPRAGSLPAPDVSAQTPIGPEKAVLIKQWCYALPSTAQREDDMHNCNDADLAGLPQDTPARPQAQLESLDPNSPTLVAMAQENQLRAQEEKNAQFKVQMLNAFARNGVPTDLMTGGMIANVINVVADLLASVSSWSSTVNDQSTANCQYLVSENKRLHQQLQVQSHALQHTNQILEAVQHSFEAFQKRATQREIRTQINELEKKVDKLREPDVTLETLSKHIKGFEHTIQKQNVNMESYKNHCAAEMERLRKTRLAFTKDAKDFKNKKNGALKDLEQQVEDMEEKLEDVKDVANSARGSCALLEERQNVAGQDLATLWSELQVLRQHVDGLQRDESDHWEEQTNYNQAFSRTLSEVAFGKYGNMGVKG